MWQSADTHTSRQTYKQIVRGNTVQQQIRALHTNSEAPYSPPKEERVPALQKSCHASAPVNDMHKREKPALPEQAPRLVLVHATVKPILGLLAVLGTNPPSNGQLQWNYQSSTTNHQQQRHREPADRVLGCRRTYQTVWVQLCGINESMCQFVRQQTHMWPQGLKSFQAMRPHMCCCDTS